MHDRITSDEGHRRGTPHSWGKAVRRGTQRSGMKGRFGASKCRFCLMYYWSCIEFECYSARSELGVLSHDTASERRAPGHRPPRPALDPLHEEQQRPAGRRGMCTTSAGPSGRQSIWQLLGGQSECSWRWTLLSSSCSVPPASAGKDLYCAD